MPARIALCLLPAVLLGLSAFQSRADEEKIPVKELPKVVRDAARAKFPRAEIVGAAREKEDGKTTYEVMFKQAGRSIDATLSQDGKILEVEREIDDADLPRAVKKAIAARFPGARIAKVEQLIEGEDGPSRYEIAITTEVVLDANGKFKKGGNEEDEAGVKSSAREKSPRKKGEKHDDDEDDDKG
jgi:hypothetical protein